METMELLKKARKQAGMTQKEFSEYFGIPCRTIEDWERGARHMANDISFRSGRTGKWTLV